MFLGKKVASSCYMEVPNEVNLGSNQEVTSVAAVGTGEDGEEDWIEVTNKANQVTADSRKILEKNSVVYLSRVLFLFRRRVTGSTLT